MQAARLKSDIASVDASLRGGSLLSAALSLSPTAIAVSFLCFLGSSISTLTTPLIFSRIMIWALEDRPDFREGALFVGALVLAAALGRISLAYFDVVAMGAGARLRNAVRGLLLARICASPLASLPKVTAGESHNLASVDVVALENLYVGGVGLIILPLEALGLLVLLWFQVSWASLATLGIAAASFCASLFLSSYAQDLLKRRALITDERIREVLAALGSTIPIKFSSLEPLIEASVLSLRKAESSVSTQSGVVFAANYLASSLSYHYISVAVFAVLTVGLGRTLGLLGFSFLATLSEQHVRLGSSGSLDHQVFHSP